MTDPALVAALDQAVASARVGYGTVTVDAVAWARLVALIDPPSATGLVRVPFGAWEGWLLDDVAHEENGRDWLEWAARRPDGFWPDWFRDALDCFLAGREVER